MDTSFNVLIIEKKDYVHYFCSKIIRFNQFRYQTAPTIQHALDICEKGSTHLIIINLDIGMNGDLGQQIRRIRYVAEHVPIVIVAEKKDVEKTVEGMKSGACNAIFKPFKNIAEIKQEITSALKKTPSKNINTTPFYSQNEGFSDGREDFCGIVGKSSYTRYLQEIIKRIAPIDVNILIIGESGTGKELIAKAIHANSHRAENKFVPVNCGGLPEGLIESSFFGHEKGAFTGADKKKSGYFEEADGGTLFLDEIGAMSHRAQVVLLRVLQEQKYMKVGGTRAISSNVRIIAATNKNLRHAAEKGDFRADLYYRLNVVSLKTAPLRERKEDIAVLIDYFMKNTCSKYAFDTKKITPQAISLLENYHWPGNVRELENYIGSLIALVPSNKKMINSSDVEEIKRRSDGSFDSGKQPGNGIFEQLLDLNYEAAKKCFEKHYFLNLLMKNNGNITHSARFARIHPATLHRKMNHLQIRPQTDCNNARV
ncbi:sigma-54 interaction domain protein [delta proteobacterium NaphS2]|nr:sigma-54 interaction domain protein [delta proteobacterium NaphS2]